MSLWSPPPPPQVIGSSGTPPTPHDPIPAQGTSVPPRRAAALAVTMMVVLASWPADLEPRLQRPNDQRQKIAPLTLKYGSQPPPTAFYSATEMGQIVASWPPTDVGPILPRPNDRQQQIAPLTLPTGQQPIPSAFLSATELNQLVSSWQSSNDAQSAPKSAAWNVPPLITSVPFRRDPLYTVTPDPLPVQRFLSVVPNFLAVSQPQPQSPLSVTELAQIVSAWPADSGPLLPWPINAPVKVAPLTLPTGIQPTPQGPLSVTEMVQFVSVWAVTWDAQAASKSAAWNVPPIPPSVPSPPFPAHVYAASALPDPQPVQRLRSIVPTRPTASQPTPQPPLSVVEITQIVATWTVTWDAQTGPKNASWNVPSIPLAVRALPLPAHVYAASQPPDLPPVQRLQSIVPMLASVIPPSPHGSAAIGNAIIATLAADATLSALCPGGVWLDWAPPNVKRFVIVHLATEQDVTAFGARAYEDGVYLIEALILFDPKSAQVGSDIASAAARIDVLLDGQTLVVAGYTWMTMQREERTRLVSLDEVDPSLRWLRRGGLYRVQVSVL
jgi:hypothetical protein